MRYPRDSKKQEKQKDISLKKERIIFFLILAVFVILYLITMQPTFLIVLAVMVLYLIFALLLRFFSGKKLKLLLSCPAECLKGEKKEIAFNIRNESLLAVFRADILFTTKNLLTGRGSNARCRCAVLPKKEKTLTMEAGDSVCGCLDIQTAQMRVGDPLFLFSRKIATDGQKAQMLILPELQEYQLSESALEGYDMESFRYADGKVGSDSSETVGIREYVPGDSVRAIHWKLSAKAGDIVIKEYGFPVDTRLLLLSDKDVRDIDAVTELSLSISDSLIRKGIDHSFGWFDADAEEFLVRQVSDPDDVYLLMPEFLKSPCSDRAADTAARFLSSGQDKNYAGYLYITDVQEEEESLEKLNEFGFVTVLTPQDFN